MKQLGLHWNLWRGESISYKLLALLLLLAFYINSTGTLTIFHPLMIQGLIPGTVSGSAT